MKFLFDNNLSPHFARAMAALSRQDPRVASIVHLREKFPGDTADATWMGTLVSEGDWIVVSHDHFRKHPLEREAFRRGGLVGFILEPNWSRQGYWLMAHNLVRWWPAIIEQNSRVQGGAAFYVPWKFTGSGRFKQY